MKNTLTKYFFVCILMLGFSVPSSATIITLDIEWSGVSFQNTAIASGFITFDDAICIPHISDCNNLTPGAGIIDLGVTISGASVGNGTFGLTDFSFSLFNSISALDYNIQLIGQIMSNGCAFGTSTGACGNGLGGDFNLFGNTSAEPYGVYHFNLATNEGRGDQMLVTSMINREVPEPTSLALLGFGLLGLGLSRRKKII